MCHTVLLYRFLFNNGEGCRHKIMWNMIETETIEEVTDSFERYCKQNDGPTGVDENFQLFNAKFLLQTLQSL